MPDSCRDFFTDGDLGADGGAGDENSKFCA